MPQDGLEPFCISSLGQIVVVAGSNGCGKTRLLKRLELYISNLQSGTADTCFSLKICNDQEEIVLGIQNANELKLANYSHFDAQLQAPASFTPYVICKAKELLKVCNYEETALNSLLLLEDIAKGYSDEFQDGTAFQKFAEQFAKPFQLQIDQDEDTKAPLLFHRSIEEAKLSPGQQYLLRIAIACYQNQDNDKLIFLLDEPELHLHPKAQIELIKALRGRFPLAQFWISTHSLELISYLSVSERDTTILHLVNGRIGVLRSNSSELLAGLIGSEENRFAIQQLMVAPDEYACNKFAVECGNPPDVVGAVGADPQTDMIRTILQTDNIVVDFGAGKGRFLEELALSAEDEIAFKIKYYAYDPDPKNAEFCKTVMRRYGVLAENYFNDAPELVAAIDHHADYVLLVNVLHEIDPNYWTNVFETIRNLLKEDGRLIIVEREELMVGEAPYNNGFLMLMEAGAKELFGENTAPERHPKKDYIVKYSIKKSELEVTEEKVNSCIQQIKVASLKKVHALKCSPPPTTDMGKFRAGIKLAFYLHQYANASLTEVGR